MGERFLYTPSLGYCIALASVLLVVVNKVWPAPGQQRAAVLAGAAGVIILLFSLKTITRNSVWGNNFALFSSGVETAPLSARAHQALAYAYTEKAQAEPEKKPQYLAAALAEYRKALAILPEYSEAWHNLGWTHFLAGNFDEAERAYKKAIEIEPGYAKTYDNLGALSFERKQYDEALRYFLRANEADPDFPDTLGNIGTVYHILGKDAEAARYYKRALGINPNIGTVRRNLEAVERALAQPGK